MTANLVKYLSADGSIGLDLQPADQLGNPYEGLWSTDAARSPVWTCDNPSVVINTKFPFYHAAVVVPPGTRATVTVTAWCKLGLPLPSKPEDYELMTATTVLDSQVPTAAGICAVPSGGTNWTLGKVVLALAVLLAIVGCTTAKATKTSKDGATDTIQVSAFLAKINQGAYSNGTGMTLSVTDASPDQQSIATLAGGVVELGKAALLLARTNSPTTATNTP